MAESCIPVPGSRYRLLGDAYEVTKVDQGFAHLRGVEVKRDRYLALAEFARKLQSGDLKLLSRAPIELSTAPLAATLSDQDRKAYERRLAYVQGVQRDLGGTLRRAPTRDLIKRVAARLQDDAPPCYETLWLWWRKFQRANGNPLALIENQGRRKTRKERLDATVSRLIDQHLRDDYLKPIRPSGKLVYDLIVNQIEGDNRNRGPSEQLPVPSPATFYRKLAKLDPYTVDLARFGQKTAEARHRYGRSIHPPVALGERVEADCQHLDVLVVDGKGALIGRPWLCALIDVTSRCVVGWEISFTPPCGAKVLRALRMAMSDETPSDYAVAPQELILDNGPEFQNTVLQTVSGIYGITLRYASPRSPNQKPHIERFFGTVNTTLTHMMPGTTRSNPSDRGEYPSGHTAQLRLSEVRDYFAFWLDNIYHQTPHSGLGARPSEVWRAASEHLPPQRYPAADLDLTCRSFVMRAIRGGRVTIMNLEWSGPSLPDISARLAIHGTGHKAKVFYDETDLSCVWVEDPDDRALLFRAEAVHPEYQNGLSLYEHKILCQGHCQGGQTVAATLLEAKAALYRCLEADGHRARKQHARLVEDVKSSVPRDMRARKALVQKPDAAVSTVLGGPEDDTDYTGFLLERP